jgi:hypothetical protein
METNIKSKKQEIPNPSIQIMDCSNNKTLVVKRVGGAFLLVVFDSSEEVNGILALNLKKPYAKNFAGLNQAILQLNDFIAEKIEVRGGE